MAEYRHHVSGFFEHKDQAQRVVHNLRSADIPDERIHWFDKDSKVPTHKDIGSSDKVLKDVVVDGAIGAVVGTGIGALVEVGLIMANVTLFVASPLIAPLVLLGWGASLGGLVGATAGAAEKIKPLSDLVQDAIRSGQYVVVVDSRSEEETRRAGEIIKAEIGDFNDAAVKRG